MTEWPEVRLSNIASRVAQKNDVGIKRVLTVSAANGLVDQETYFTKKIASRDLTNYWVVEPGDLVYNKSTSKDAPFGVVARHYADEPALVTSLYIVLRADVAKVVPEYLKLACNGAAFFGSLAGTLREGARSHGLLNVRLQEFFGAKSLFRRCPSSGASWTSCPPWTPKLRRWMMKLHALV